MNIKLSKQVLVVLLSCLLVQFTAQAGSYGPTAQSNEQSPAPPVKQTPQELQQLVAPIQMVMMLPWFIMFAIITSPDSPLSVALSMAPVYGPITMFVRTLVSEPPVWHVLVSIAVSIATIAVFFYITAKIFRVGILSYGKRPTIPELWRWLKVA